MRPAKCDGSAPSRVRQRVNICSSTILPGSDWRVGSELRVLRTDRFLRVGTASVPGVVYDHSARFTTPGPPSPVQPTFPDSEICPALLPDGMLTNLYRMGRGARRMKRVVPQRRRREAAKRGARASPEVELECFYDGHIEQHRGTLCGRLAGGVRHSGIE